MAGAVLAASGCASQAAHSGTGAQVLRAEGATTASSTAPSTAPKAGKISIFQTVGYTGKGSTTVTGVIGDYGTEHPTNREGVADTNGDFEKVVLKHGTFLMDERALNGNSTQLHTNSSQKTCSISYHGTSGIPVSGGTGRYAGISGTVTGTFYLGVVEPRITSGRFAGICSSKNVTGARHFSVLISSGSVSF